MNHPLANIVGWMASLLFIAVAIVLWGIAALLVWTSGNRTATCTVPRFAR